MTPRLKSSPPTGPAIPTVGRALLEWFASAARDLPWRRTRDPYAIWVSEIMLQQTQVKTVIPYWERWMKALPDVAALASADPAALHKLWEGLGYYTRVRNMQKAAQAMVRDHGGQFPNRFEEVLALPGIGRYTAGAICSIAFGQPTPLVDGNVIRVLARVFAIAGNPRERLVNDRFWQQAEQLVNAAADGKPTPGTNAPGALNQALMELGALICTPRAPACLICPLHPLCVARKEGRVSELPELPARVAMTARRFLAVIVEGPQGVLVRQRPAGVVNAHLWEFPNFEVAPIQKRGSLEEEVREGLRREWNVELQAWAPFKTVRHSITRYRMTLEAVRVLSVGQPPETLGHWKRRSELAALPFNSAHGKLRAALLEEPAHEPKRQFAGSMNRSLSCEGALT